MDDAAEMAFIAARLADRSRMAMVVSLMDGQARTSTDLGLAVNVSAPSASMHLAKLVQAGILIATENGRNKYYRIASPAIAHAVEAIAAAVRAPLPIREPAEERRRHQTANPWAFARACYDHLAGWLGVELADALERRDYVRPGGRAIYVVTSNGIAWMKSIGIDWEQVADQRRESVTQCLDWTEQRSHIGGALGAALFHQMLRLEWVVKSRIPRLIRVTHKGESEFEKQLSLVIAQKPRLR
jgi:DNA-binding transcriptional ArsR family regulator